MRFPRDRRLERLERRIVWIFGSPRSGSTWLARMLAEHPGVVVVDEPLIGRHLAPTATDLGRYTEAGLRPDALSLPQIVGDRREDYFFSEASRAGWLPGLRRLILERLDWHVRAHRPSGSALEALVVKEPNGSQAAEVIADALPGSRILFLLRDGRDVVDSELAAAREGAWLGEAFPMARAVEDHERLAFVGEAAHRWLWRDHVVAAAFDKHPGPKLQIRYEHLLSDTAAGLGAIAAAAGLRIDHDLLAEIADRHAFTRIPVEQRGPDRFFRAAKPGLWRENLTEEERATVSAILGPRLRALGYPG